MAVAHQLVQSAQGFFNGRGFVKTMHLVQVDMVKLQALHAGLDAVQDVAARQAAGVDAVCSLAKHFCRHHNAVARRFQVFEGLAGDFFRHSAGVHIGGVDEINACVNGLTNQLLSFLLA